MAWVYILRCCDGSYYVGSTNLFEFRMKQHHDGEGCSYTRKRLPVELAWCAEFETVAHAFAFEHQIKKWSRAKKEALIEGRFDALAHLASRSELARRDRHRASDDHRPFETGASAPSSGTQRNWVPEEVAQQPSRRV